MPRKLTVTRGLTLELPLFIPVYRPNFTLTTLQAWSGNPEIRGCIVNSFFLYKDREIRTRFKKEQHTLHEHIGFDGLICTDSGAFQGFKRRLYLENKKIIRFQDSIKSDVAAPLDLITPPWDKRSVAEQKLRTTQKRTRQGLEIVQHSLMAGIQQGGRFMDLRHQSVCELVEMGVPYLGIGSLVPFFNRDHDLSFVGQVIRDARQEAGPDKPMHIYGAGDPLELPFMAACGADIFDSSSYAHYAKDGWYMTPYGALSDLGPVLAGEYQCDCPHCSEIGPESTKADEEKLAVHNLWTICTTVEKIRTALAEDTLSKMLAALLSRHQNWFPDSRLPETWHQLNE
ncbi:MAG: tRNA-guanine transglycosylase [Magnetococcales bacterium]|nr:tRNA-guanine transglycosylase [Magnetococcales bacterium]